MGKLSETRAIRLGFAVMFGYTVVNTWFAWSLTSTATDLAWLYYVMFPISAAALLVPVVWPRNDNLYVWLLPTFVISIVRQVDFLTDWFWFPDAREPISLSQRLGSGFYGWGMIGGAIVVLYGMDAVIDRLVETVRYHRDPA